MAYRGIVGRLPVGQTGFNGTQNPSQAEPSDFLYVDGVELDGGIIRKEGGATKLNPNNEFGPNDILWDDGDEMAWDDGDHLSWDSTLLTIQMVISGINWSPQPGDHRDVVIIENGEVYQDLGSGTFPDIMATGLNVPRDPPPYFVAAGGESVGGDRKLFMFSSSNQVQEVIGTAATMAAIGSPAADWSGTANPTFGVQHGLRMFAGGNTSDPHRIYYSTIADHGDYLGAGSGTLAIFPGEGERLVAGISFRGALVLFKYPTGIYVVTTTDPSPANWKVDRLTRSVGSLSQHTIVPIENDVLYMDRIGNIHALSGTQEFGDVNTSNIGNFKNIPVFMREEIALTNLRRAVGVWYPLKRQAWFAIPLLGSLNNDLRFIIGFNDDGQGSERVSARFFMSRRDIAISMWMRPDDQDIHKPVIGDDLGIIWNLDTEDREKDGAAYPMRFETANTDLAFIDPSLATRMKAGQFLELAFEPRGDWFLNVEIYWDDALTQTLLYNMGVSGASLGTFVLGTDVLASNVVSSKRERVVGSGRRVRLAAENAGLNQDVSLAEFHLSFSPMDERD